MNSSLFLNSFTSELGADFFKTLYIVFAFDLARESQTFPILTFIASGPGISILKFIITFATLFCSF